MILSQADVTSNGKAILLDGAFDPMHAGHVRYLDFAASAFPSSYTRYVSVASDDDIRAKGREPLFDQMTRATVMDSLRGVDAVILKTGPIEQVIAKLRPAAYIKGRDWEGKLPPEQLTACSLYGIQIIYTDTVQDSSSGALRRWALRDADAGLDRLETFIANQKPVTEPWQPVTDYSCEARKQIEGRHPQLIKDVFQPRTVIDAGCGPDGHLIRLLREVGVQAEGFDVQERRSNDLRIWHGDIAGQVNEVGQFDLVICREVLEHLSVTGIRKAVTNLCRLSTRFVYGTTRFNPSPRHMLDFTTEFDADPTHISCGTHAFLRMLFALEGFRCRADLAERMDWLKKGRAFVFERAS